MSLAGEIVGAAGMEDRTITMEETQLGRDMKGHELGLRHTKSPRTLPENRNAVHVAYRRVSLLTPADASSYSLLSTSTSLDETSRW